MKDSWRHFAAEFIGTFALVFVGGGAIITSPLLQMQAAVVNIALAHGLILALMVTAT
ncbi:MAG: aquaporin, partial [Gemmatimonadaceae bacterium]